MPPDHPRSLRLWSLLILDPRLKALRIKKKARLRPFLSSHEFTFPSCYILPTHWVIFSCMLCCCCCCQCGINSSICSAFNSINRLSGSTIARRMIRRNCWYHHLTNTSGKSLLAYAMVAANTIHASATIMACIGPTVGIALFPAISLGTGTVEISY